MKRVLGIVLLVLGILALVYGGFSYTEESHDIDLGVVELQAKEKERVNVPAWAGVGAIIVGAVLLVVDRKR